MKYVEDLPCVVYATAGTCILCNGGHSSHHCISILALQAAASHHHDRILGFSQDLRGHKQAENTGEGETTMFDANFSLYN